MAQRENHSEDRGAEVLRVILGVVVWKTLAAAASNPRLSSLITHRYAWVFLRRY